MEARLSSFVKEAPVAPLSWIAPLLCSWSDCGDVRAGINDPFVDSEYSAYMMKYDSVHGRYPDVQADGDSIIVSGHKVHCFSEM